MKGDGFSMAQFLDANIGPEATQKPLRFFLGGKLSYIDQDLSEKYTFVPYGLLDEFQSQSIPPLSLNRWYSSQVKVKTIVRKRLPILPPNHLYNDETWEWTIVSVGPEVTKKISLTLQHMYDRLEIME